MASLNSSEFTATAAAESSIPQTNGEFQTLKALLVSSAHLIHDTYSGFIAPLIPTLIERFSLMKVEASFFLFLYQGVSILQPVIGHWADRVNLRKIALIGPAVTGIFLSLLGTAPSYPSLCFTACWPFFHPPPCTPSCRLWWELIQAGASARA